MVFYPLLILINIQFCFIFSELGLASALLGSMYGQLNRSILQECLRTGTPLIGDNDSNVRAIKEFPSLEMSMA